MTEENKTQDAPDKEPVVTGESAEGSAENGTAKQPEGSTGAAPSGDAGADESADRAPASRRRAKGARIVSSGVAHVKATFNNTIISITDMHGGVISWCSAGRAGFKGSRKSTAFAATVVAQEAARQAMTRGLHEIEVRVQGAGAGRESAVRGLQSAGLSITLIKDVTPIPHNGCRPRKRRRV